MSGGPPRRQRPPRLVEPFPPADDFEEIPISLESEYVPTMRDLSEQIGSVSSHLQVVHEEAALARASADNAAVSARAAHAAIAEVRTLVIGDHAPRISEVERRAPGIPSGVKKGAAYGIVAAAWPLLEWLIPLAQKWIDSR